MLISKKTILLQPLLSPLPENVSIYTRSGYTPPPDTIGISMEGAPPPPINN
jgi:hypothetical protein